MYELNFFQCILNTTECFLIKETRYESYLVRKHLNNIRLYIGVDDTIQYHFICLMCIVNMNTTTFYGNRQDTKVTTLAEVHDLVECSDNVVSVVVLPPDAGDDENLVSDEEELQENPETAHEPAGLLVVEEEVEDDAEETIHQRDDGSKLQSLIQRYHLLLSRHLKTFFISTTYLHLKCGNISSQRI